MSNQPAPYPIRMPEELRNVLVERAREGGRSLHAEIIGILQDAVDGSSGSRGGVNVDVLAEAVAVRVIAKLGPK
jgi:plasmid stability protein